MNSLISTGSPFDSNCNTAPGAGRARNCAPVLDAAVLDAAVLDARAPLWLDLDGSVRGMEGVERLDWRDLGGSLRYLATRSAMRRAQIRLKALDAADARCKHRLTLLGSGDYHHLTEFLVGRFSAPLSVIVFDQHPDWDITSPWACCGCWVPRVLQMPHVERVIVIGAGREDLRGHHLWRGATKWLRKGRLEIYPATFSHSKIPARGHQKRQSLRCGEIKGGQIAWKTVEETGMSALIASVLAGLPTEDVYLSVDKDCLLRDFGVSNWGAGELELPDVCGAIESIGLKKRIVGGDITGEWSGGQPRNPLFRAISGFDHPPQTPPTRAALQRNAQTNAALQLALVRAAAA